MPDSTDVDVWNVRKVSGIAGQVEIMATVRYPGEAARQVSFVGSVVYGGPVVMVTDAGQTFVREPGRFGDFGTEWVRRFFASS